MNDRTKNCQVGIVFVINGTNQRSAFKTVKRVHESRSFSGFHVEDIITGEMDCRH
jgi:hypothetical protein